MRRLPLAAVLLFVTSALPAQTLGPVDWIFLVDTSKSMRGLGGTNDIWLDVQASLNAFLRQTGPEDTVTMYGFDRDVREVLAPPNGDLYRAILELRAEGNRTHLGAAIARGLGRAEQLRLTSGDATRRQVVVLFTDGKEDVRGIKDPVPIDANLGRVGETFVFFVSMGEHEPKLDAFAAATNTQTTVLKAPSPEAIRDVARQIRVAIPPLPAPPPPPKPRFVPRATPPAPVEKSSPVMAALIALAFLAVITFLLLQQHRRKNRLEGELEILRPRAAPDAAFVGLPSLQTSEIVLSAILPAEALAGSDARLFVRRSGSRKKVWIAAQSGSLRINEVETPMSELYDADTIEIGDAKVRFNRVGDERPSDFNQEGSL
jgi:von Willebrand factor type A domain